MKDVMGCKGDEEKIDITETCKNSDNTVIKEDEIGSEMAEVREENRRLKTLLHEIKRDYRTLQMRFDHIFHQEPKKNGTQISGDDHDHDQEHELVSLRLGTSQPELKKEEIHVTSTSTGSSKVTSESDELKLGLDYNHEVLKAEDHGAVRLPKNPGRNKYSLTGAKEDDRAGEKWPPGKGLKTQRSGDEELSQTDAKRARVCVRARCDTPTMNDGCQWRKYGQKIAKGNPCPRAYYRCTVSPSCPVKKQVQRCVEDMSILITTYEGTHNHPLPVTATAMASTTSAAASVLLSGSSTSQTPPTFHSLSSYRIQPNYYVNSSPLSPFPTITLDLTANTSAASSGFTLYSSISGTTPTVPAATSLSFSSMDSNTSPTVWSSGGFSQRAFPHGNDHGHLFLPGNSAQERKYGSNLEKLSQANSPQHALTDTLTKVLTSDPSFRSVIAAAISSMASNGGPGEVNDNKGESLEQNLKKG